jgi:hypothetical protein
MMRTLETVWNKPHHNPNGTKLRKSDFLTMSSSSEIYFIRFKIRQRTYFSKGGNNPIAFVSAASGGVLFEYNQM